MFPLFVLPRHLRDSDFGCIPRSRRFLDGHPPVSRKTGLWRFQLVMAAAQNAAYGSSLSPPRLQQLREAVASYRAAHSFQTDELFQMWAPAIAEQQKVDLSLPGAMENLYASLATDALLHNKGENVIPLGRLGASPPGSGF